MKPTVAPTWGVGVYGSCFAMNAMSAMNELSSIVAGLSGFRQYRLKASLSTARWRAQRGIRWSQPVVGGRPREGVEL